jgi:hypothetical protein
VKKKPEIYNVHGVLYRIVDVDDGDFGECDREKGLIKLLSTLAPSPRAATKKHELGHAAWWESGIYQRHWREYGAAISEEIEEDVMERFLPVLHNIKRVS